MHTVAALTLNIWNRQGPWAERQPRIQAGLAALQPDLIGLQEVLRLSMQEHDSNQAEELVNPGEYHSAYAPAQELGAGLHIGNSLLSKHPILSAETIILPGEEETAERRSLLAAQVMHPAGTLPVYVTHLNWKLDQGSVRTRQVQRIVQEIESRLKDDHLPALLMGDFNAEPPSDEIRYLKGFATLDGRSVHFSDAWDYAEDRGPGYTFDRKNPYAAEAHEPPRRIDYIFVRGPDSQYRGEPLETRLVMNEPDSAGIWPSDHFGVWSRILLSR